MPTEHITTNLARDTVVVRQVRVEEVAEGEYTHPQIMKAQQTTVRTYKTRIHTRSPTRF
jgi:hypothetical protein